jgi:hypothetical protein
VADPLLFPQFAFEAVAETIGVEVDVIVAVAVPAHPFASLTVTVYVPAARPVAELVEAPLLHE